MPHLRDGGRIVNISSMGTRADNPTMAAYALAKAGLKALGRLLAVDFGGRRITVNSAMPGATATEHEMPVSGAREVNIDVAALRNVCLSCTGAIDIIAAIAPARTVTNRHATGLRKRASARWWI